MSWQSKLQNTKAIQSSTKYEKKPMQYTKRAYIKCSNRKFFAAFERESIGTETFMLSDKIFLSKYIWVVRNAKIM